MDFALKKIRLRPEAGLEPHVDLAGGAKGRFGEAALQRDLTR